MPTPLDRVFEAAGCRTQTELAAFLRIRQSSIALTKKKGKVPSGWPLKLWRKKGINPDWILTGQGGKMFLPTTNTGSSAADITAGQTLEQFSFEELLQEVIRRIKTLK